MASGSEPSSANSPSFGGTPPPPIGVQDGLTTAKIYSPSGGGQRTALVHVPEALRATLSRTNPGTSSTSGPAEEKPLTPSSSVSTAATAAAAAAAASSSLSWPLIIAFHDKQQSPEAFAAETQLADSAFNRSYLVIFPAGLRHQWTGDPNAPSRSQVNDLMFVDDLLQWALQRYPVDASRIFLAGVSNGAGLAALIACHPRLSHAICAVGLASSSLFLDESFEEPMFSKFEATRFPMPLLEFHGDADPIVDYNGTDTLDGPSWPMGRWIRLYTRMNERGLNGGQSLGQVAEEEELYSGKVERFVWRCGTDMEIVVHYMLHGFGHGWPTTTPRENEEIRRGPAELNATPIMLEFFDKVAMYPRHDFSI